MSKQQASLIQRYATDPMAFLDDLQIPSAHGPRRFGDVMAPFQRERFKALAPALLAVVRNERPPVGRHWLEASKGASKDSDLAACLLWLLAFVRRPLDCQVGAADADQADELRKAARDILYLNPWLNARIAIQNRRIVCESTGAAALIIAADTVGSHGARPDVLIINELSHIAKQEFAENLMDNAAKVPSGLVVVATNAGFTDTWQYRWRELARESARWYFHVWDKPAPWLDAAEIEEAKRRNSASRYLRLWWGIWASGNGDALDPEDIQAAINPAAGPLMGSENLMWVAGLDIGIRHDLASLVVLGVSTTPERVRLADCLAWAPTAGRDVLLKDVEGAVLNANLRFPGLTVGFDPNQCSYLAQRCRAEGLHMIEVPFVGKHLDRMASAVLQVFKSRTITLYNDPDLIAELGRLMLVERPYGYKLEAARTKEGHADRAMALSIALSLTGDAMLGCGHTLVIDGFSFGGTQPCDPSEQFYY